MELLSENKISNQKHSLRSECKLMKPSQTMVHAKLEKTLPGAAKYIIAIGAGWTAGIYSVDLVKNAAPYAIENTKTQMESGDLKYWKAAQWGF